MPSGTPVKPESASGRQFWLVLLAACLSFSMGFYVVRILIPYQVADALAHLRPRGNLSDLYPRWLGARELWERNRNPYGEDVTRDIQIGYYGRSLDPGRPQDPKDQQGFAYPVYVTFLLLPTLYLSFETVRVAFTWFLLVLIFSSVFSWLQALRWRPGWPVTTATILLTVGSFAGLQAVKLQQLSVVVVFLVALSAALLVSGELFVAGLILAIATIKPQLVALISGWLIFWSLSDWRNRRSFFLGFFGMLFALFLGGFWLLPGWFGDFLHAMQRYQQYTGGHSRLDVLLGPIFGKIASALVILVLGAFVIRFGKVPAQNPNFVLVFAAILTVTLLVMPNFAPYNELLLLPAILLIVRELGSKNRPPGFFAIAAATGFFLSWGWVAALVLTVASLFLTGTMVQRAWAVPLWSEFAIVPSTLLALAFLLQRMWRSVDGRSEFAVPSPTGPITHP